MLCTACGVGNLIEDTVGSEENLVCESCGCISKDTRCNHLKDSQTVAHTKKISEYKYREGVEDVTSKRRYRLKKYFVEIEHCIRQYSKQSCALELEAKNLFFSTVENHSLLSQSTEKMRIAAASSYIVLRQNCLPVNARHICTMMGIKLFKFYRCLNMVKQVSGRTFCNADLDEVEVSLHGLPCFQNRESLMKKAIEIANFLKQISIADGRTPRKLAYFSAYLAFVSEEKKSKCIAMAKFSAMNNIFSKHGNFGMNDALTAFKERLFILIKRLPWMQSKDFKEHSFHLLINDLLRYKDMLLKDYKESGLAKAETDAITLPPCFLRSPEPTVLPTTSYPIASDSKNVTEDDLPEEELASYLRTSDEIKEVTRIKSFMADSKQ